MPNTSWNIMVTTTTQIQQKGLAQTLQHGWKCFVVIKWCNAKWVQTTSHATKLPHFTTQHWNKNVFSFIHIHKRNTRTQYQLQETNITYSFLLVARWKKGWWRTCWVVLWSFKKLPILILWIFRNQRIISSSYFKTLKEPKVFMKKLVVLWLVLWFLKCFGNHGCIQN